MNDQLKRLGLTQLAQVLPTLLEEARQQQLSYEAFLRQALEAELGRTPAAGAGAARAARHICRATCGWTPSISASSRRSPSDSCAS